MSGVGVLLYVVCSFVPVVLFYRFLRVFFQWRKSAQARKYGASVRTVAFFHPYCNAGGGGERVLWCTIRAMQERHPDYAYVVYTGDTDADAAEILARAKVRFNIEFARPVRFIYLTRRWLVEAERYPRFTLLGQSFGGLLLGAEALWRFVPDVFIDSMGYAFTLPLFRFVGDCSVGAYIHYPTISTDMLDKVASREATYNNAGVVAQNEYLTKSKLVYYRLFALLYGFVGRAAHVVLVNSTWTRNHIVRIWKQPSKTHIVYPPCDVLSFKVIENSGEVLLAAEKAVRIVSIGQFRPEKNHSLQLQTLKAARDLLKSKELKLDLKLVLVGSCRHQEDKDRVEKLQEEAVQLGIEQSVEWKLNVDFKELKQQLGKALIGIHTMWNEHFGIGVVEGMAAGNVMIAHDSGGPKSDIVAPANSGSDRVGYLAASAAEYAEAILEIVRLTSQERSAVRRNAAKAVERFSDSVFAAEIINALEPIL